MKNYLKNKNSIKITLIVLATFISSCADMQDKLSKMGNRLGEMYISSKYKQDEKVLNDLKDFYQKANEVKASFGEDEKVTEITENLLKYDKLLYKQDEETFWLSQEAKEISKLQQTMGPLMRRLNDNLSGLSGLKDSDEYKNYEKEQAKLQKFKEKDMEELILKAKDRVRKTYNKEIALYKNILAEGDKAYKGKNYKLAIDTYDKLGGNYTCKTREKSYISKRELGKKTKFNTREEKDNFDTDMGSMVYGIIECYESYMDKASAARVQKIGFKYGDLYTNEQVDAIKQIYYEEMY